MQAGGDNFGIWVSHLASLICSALAQLTPSFTSSSQLRPYSSGASGNTGGQQSYSYYTSNNVNANAGMQPQAYNYSYSWQSGNAGSGGAASGQRPANNNNQQWSNGGSMSSNTGNQDNSFDYSGSSGDYQTGGPDSYQQNGATGGSFDSYNQAGLGYAGVSGSASSSGNGNTNTQSQSSGRMAPPRPLGPILNTNNPQTPGIGPDSYQQPTGSSGNRLPFGGSGGSSSGSQNSASFSGSGGVQASSGSQSYTNIAGQGDASETWQGGNAIYATGYTGAPGACVLDGTDYYVNMRNELIRVDPTAEMVGTDTEVRITGNVQYAFHGMDDAVWFVDTNGRAWRLHYRKNPEMVPNQPQVRFTRISPRNWDEALAATDSGDLYRYTNHKWIRDRSASNVRDVGVGNDGMQMYVDRNQRIFMWNWETNAWVPYEVNGKGFDLYDADHVVVFDNSNNVRKRVNGRWVGDAEKCKDVFLRDDSYYCITPDNSVHIVLY
ncbi:uncharacterized transmembrane protein DDB_G0289901-like isoform X2 [Paramacrobiotus metropolitanus]|uniref:uncharacterized transmembrane protein DDB_G0289901-like isoform X2 n=1 Tax=Paramacrobiotus metropolitanus TaxID=2943436 RepID=UPI0024461EF8|nr:uncharacterized transmembrane protein DDB_G0289901-like isoform X2 [Paramacrobiotus metropolitanus]